MEWLYFVFHFDQYIKSGKWLTLWKGEFPKQIMSRVLIRRWLVWETGKMFSTILKMKRFVLNSTRWGWKTFDIPFIISSGENTWRITKEMIKVLPISDHKEAGIHRFKSVHIGSFSGLYFHAFGRNTERYSTFFRIQTKYEKIWNRKTPNKDTFHAFTKSIFQAKMSSEAAVTDAKDAVVFSLQVCALG